MFSLLWFLAIVVLVVVIILRIKLVCMLREIYPALYVRIGSPGLFTNDLGFVYRLMSIKNIDMPRRDYRYFVLAGILDPLLVLLVLMGAVSAVNLNA